MAQLVEVVLGDEEREVLERWARRPQSSQALAFRCRVVLASAEGRSSTEIAAEVFGEARYRGRVERIIAGRGDRVVVTGEVDARGLDGLWGAYQWLDRAPLGRNETGVWWRRHDEYDAG